MNATTTTETGTVKIGRWSYPATRANGTVEYSTKGGDKTATDKQAEAFVPDAPTAEKVEAELNPAAFAILAAVANNEFDYFDGGLTEGSGIWFDHMASQLPGDATAVKAAMRRLVKAELFELGDVDKDMEYPDRWFCLTAKGAEAAIQLKGREIPMPEMKSGASKPRSPRVAKPKGEGKPCLCECGETAAAERYYLPGHDARHAGVVGRAIMAGGKSAELLASLPTAALRNKAREMVARKAAKAEASK